MAWDDRPHYRDHSASTNPLGWLGSGSLPLGSLFGVRIRAHSSLIAFVLGAMVLSSSPISLRVLSMGIWVLMLVLHELAHCAIARRQGGFADEVLLWPAGGLTPAEPAHRAGATFITAMAGPALNLILCVAAGVGFCVLTPTFSGHAVGVNANMLNPFHGLPPDVSLGWREPA